LHAAPFGATIAATIRYEDINGVILAWYA